MNENAPITKNRRISRQKNGRRIQELARPRRTPKRARGESKEGNKARWVILSHTYYRAKVFQQERILLPRELGKNVLVKSAQKQEERKGSKLSVKQPKRVPETPQDRRTQVVKYQ